MAEFHHPQVKTRIFGVAPEKAGGDETFERAIEVSEKPWRKAIVHRRTKAQDPSRGTSDAPDVPTTP